MSDEDRAIEATLLRQARYVLQGLAIQHRDCGYMKMADACERAADYLIAIAPVFDTDKPDTQTSVIAGEK